MNRWLDEQVHDAVSTAQRLRSRGFDRLWLHYQRGHVLVSEHLELEGYELGSPLTIPMALSKAEIGEWIRHHLRNVPCHP